MSKHYSKQEIINGTLKQINKVRTEFGLAPIELLKGNQSKMTSCPIQKGLGIRNKVGGTVIHVRSKKTAERISKLWGGAKIARTAATWSMAMTGLKDFPWTVELPKVMQAFVDKFDSNELAHLAQSSKTVGTRFGDPVIQQTFKSNVKKVGSVTVDTDTAMEIVNAL